MGRIRTVLGAFSLAIVGVLVAISVAHGSAFAAAPEAVRQAIARMPQVVSIGPPLIPGGAPLPVLQSALTSDPADPESHVPAQAPPGGAYVQDGAIRIPEPTPPSGPRRVGIQVGHWQTDAVPSELQRLVGQYGASWGDTQEIDVNMAIAQRVAALLRAHSVAVDLLPATIPPGYVADAFLAIHADSDGTGDLSGFKIAHGPARGPFEDRLVSLIAQHYGADTGLRWDGAHVSPAMTLLLRLQLGSLPARRRAADSGRDHRDGIHLQRHRPHAPAGAAVRRRGRDRRRPPGLPGGDTARRHLRARPGPSAPRTDHFAFALAQPMKE